MDDTEIIEGEELMSCLLRDGNDREEKIPIRCDDATRYVKFFVPLFYCCSHRAMVVWYEKCSKNATGTTISTESLMLT